MHGSITLFHEESPPTPTPDDSEQRRLARIKERRASMFMDVAQARMDAFRHTQSKLKIAQQAEAIEMDGKVYMAPTDILEEEFGLEDSSGDEGDGNYSSSEEEGHVPGDEELEEKLEGPHAFKLKRRILKYVHKANSLKGSSHCDMKQGAENCPQAALMYDSTHVAGAGGIRCRETLKSMQPAERFGRDSTWPLMATDPVGAHPAVLGAETTPEELATIEKAVLTTVKEFEGSEDNRISASRQGRRPYVKVSSALNVLPLPIVRSKCIGKYMNAEERQVFNQNNAEKATSAWDTVREKVEAATLDVKKAKGKDNKNKAKAVVADLEKVVAELLKEKEAADKVASSKGKDSSSSIRLGRLGYINYGIGSKLVLAIAAGLETCKMPLIELDLSGNFVTPSAGAKLIAALWGNQECGHHLVDFRMRGNQLGEGLPLSVQEVTDHLGMFLVKCSKLARLDLSANHLTDVALLEIFTQCHKCKEDKGADIQYLDLSGNKMGGVPRKKANKKGEVKLAANASKACATFVKSAENLKGLNLASNRLCRMGARQISYALSQSQSLQTVNLSFNHLGDRPCGSLARLMQKNPSIKHIDLTACNISYIGAEMLGAQAMATTQLEKIVLDLNTIGRRGGRAVVRGLIRGAGERAVSRVSIDGCDVKLDDSQYGGVRSLITGPDRSGIYHGKPYPFMDEYGDQCIWHGNNPCGTYRFDLKDPYQRAQAQQAMDQAAQRLPKKEITSVTMNGSAFKWSEDCPMSYINIPFQGTLKLTWGNPPAAPLEENCIDDETLKAIVKVLGVGIEGITLVPDMGDIQRQHLMEIIAREIYVLPSQLSMLLSKFDKGDPQVTAVTCLYPQIVGEREAVHGAIEAVIGSSRMTQLELALGELWHWCEANPCGHYIINCASTADRALLTKLMQFAAAERKVREKGKPKVGSGPVDPSQKETGECWRNETWKPVGKTEGYPAVLQSGSECLVLVAEEVGKKTKKKKKNPTKEEEMLKPPMKEFNGEEWQIIPSGIPSDGTLEFDFVPFARAPVNVQPIEQIDLTAMVQRCQRAAARAITAYKTDKAERDTVQPKKHERDEYDVLKTLEMKSILRELRKQLSKIYVSVTQVLSLFKLAGRVKNVTMVEIFMACWNRIVDTDNLYYVRVYLTPPPPPEDEIQPVLSLQTMLKVSGKVLELPKAPVDEWKRLQSRVGTLNLFNPMHLEGSYQLNIEHLDDRKVAIALITLATKEEGPKGVKDTLTNFAFTSIKGKKISRLPETWPAEMPKAGTWEVDYYTQEEFTNKEGVHAWVDWKLRVKTCEDIKNWKQIRKPAGGLPKQKKDEKDGPPPHLYHIESYRKQKEFWEAEAEFAAEKAAEEQDRLEGMEMQAALDMEEAAAHREIIANTDITSVNHYL